jgi:hypothetical protein
VSIRAKAYKPPSQPARRTVYFFMRDTPLQFKVCAIFQLSIDCGEYAFVSGHFPIATHMLTFSQPL